MRLAKSNKSIRPSANARKTNEIIKRAEANGLLPLDVMLENMNFYHRQAEEAQFKLLTRSLWAVEGNDPSEGMFDGGKHVLELRKRAGDEAARAAHYMHAPLASIDQASAEEDEEFIPLAERLKYYASRDAAKAADAKPADREP